MGENWGLRLRFSLFFAGLAVGGTALIVAGLWLAQARYGGPTEGYVIAGLIAGFGLLALVAWVGHLFDENVARPILGLASDLETRARAQVGADIDTAPARYLGALAPAANAIHDALTEARAAQMRAIEAETRRLSRDKALLEALLHDLSDAAVVLSPDLRIMLYNRMAQELLGPIGLDRPVTGFLRSDPLEHAIERLSARRERGETPSEQFLTATLDGTRFLLGRVSPVATEEARIGHVLIFHDATDDLDAHAERDHLFNALIEQVRRPAAAISALLDVLGDSDMPDKQRATFNAAMQDELGRLFANLRDGARAHGAIAARHWPMSEVAVQDVFDALNARTGDDVSAAPSPHFLRCDGFAISALLARVVQGLQADGTRSDIALAAEAHDREVWLTINWQGQDAPDGLIQEWVKQDISDAYGQYSGRDVLESHRTEIWSETLGHAHRIVLPLPLAGAPLLAPRDARPEFYDFDLPSPDLSRDLAETPLRKLKFVVFDTETTGLSPRNGDEIVQIAGLRVVNGRVLSGEAFDTLVNPGRLIPPASTKVHGIDDSMVTDAPDITAAGQRFHAFCEDAILVAHNAPFDIAFLRLKEAQIAREFRQPYLCTVLLSAALFEHTGNHTLDALADRFGIEIPAHLRHTALGDATATAEVFLRMIDVMEGAGIVTLGDALAASQRMRRIRKAQDY
jgi:DNA polymerase-3 subunit epsilon